MSTPPALSVLTVDDEPHVHSGLDSIIDWNELGCRHVGSALDGKQALEFIAAHLPDVIITDIKMPVMDGLEVVKRVRSIHGYAPAIVVLTGYDDFEYARTALRSGVRDYLLKPVDEEELGRVLTAIRNAEPPGRHVPVPETSLIYSGVISRLVAARPGEDTVATASQLLQVEPQTPLRYALIAPLEDRPAEPGLSWSLTALMDVVTSTVFRESAGWMFQEAEDSIGWLLLPPEAGGGEPSARLRLKGLHRRLSQVFQIPLVVVAGPLVRGAAEAWRSREGAWAFLDAHYLMASPGFYLVPTEPTSASREAPAGEAVLDRLPSETVARVVDALEQQELDRATRAVEESLRLVETRAVAARAIRNWLYALQTELNRLVWDLDGAPSGAIAAIGPLAENLRLRPIGSLRAAILDALEATARQVADLRRLGTSSIVRLVKRRIDRCYAEQISLAELADEFGANPVYLGQLFKRSVGTSFKCYLRGLRIREARRLLEATDLRAFEVAARVGYQDIDYFAEQFRRETGTTPIAFRASARRVRSDRRSET